MLGGGIAILSAVSWAAAIIIQNSKLDMITHNPGMSNQVYYTIGRDIYIGWVAGVLGAIAGGLLLCGGFQQDEELQYATNDTMVSTGPRKIRARTEI